MTQPGGPQPVRAPSGGVHPCEPRHDVHVRFADGREFAAPAGTTLEAFLRAAEPHPSVPIVAAISNGRLRELTQPVWADATVQAITLESEDGMRIYRRSLSFLMAAVAGELFPEAQVVVEYSVYSGGYFCQTRGRASFTDDELRRIEERMRAMVAADLPFGKQRVALEDARELFTKHGDDDKVRLLQSRRKDHLVIYSLELPERTYRDYFHGYLAPSTGLLQWFGLRQADGGFIVQFPRRSAPMVLTSPVEHDRLFEAFREYNTWLDVLGIGDVGSLNEAVRDGNMREVILVSEALHEKRIARIAEQVAARRSRLVLIAGPSSSGKTTFSKRLSIQLLANGLRPFPLAMDDYFVERSKTVRNERGEPDYECLEALDLDLLDRHIMQLIDGESVDLPHYDFKSGVRRPGQTVRLGQDRVIVAEGIHGLNPKLFPDLSRERVYRIYASALTALNLDRHNRVSTTDTRLIRRIVRDAASRGYAAQATLARWDSVRRGEAKWIFPHQENSDAMFNTALVYEQTILRPLVEPLLLQVPPDTPEHIEAKRLLARLEWFDAGLEDGMSADRLVRAVPQNSILREFIGPSTIFDELDFRDMFA